MPLQKKVIKGFGGNYIVHSDGNVTSKKRNEEVILKPQLQRGKAYVFLYDANKKKYVRKSLVRLVANAFVPNPNQYTIIRTLNNDISDVSADNLRWVAWRKCIQCDRYCDECSKRRHVCVIDIENREQQNKDLEEATRALIANNIERAGGITALRKPLRYIADELQNGESVKTIAKRYGCTIQYVYRVRKRLLENDTNLRE